ncbi:MAG: PAS domain S-box protein, partial [Methanosarcinales archaeon]|nr:PAS domain S-box protein [Methanosarcinales archaeon]
CRRGILVFKATGCGPVVGKTLELEAVRKDGTMFPIELSVSAVKIGEEWHATGIVRDITERKQAEDERETLIRELHDALAERSRSEKKIQDLQRYNRGLVEASPDPLVTFDQKGIIMDVNEAKIRATGRTREELIGTPFADYFTDSEEAYKEVMLVFETGEVRDYELVMKARDGTETVVSYNASVYKDQKGNVVGAFAAARDITERKRAEQELRESKAELDLIFRIAADGMCVIGADYNIIKVNKTFIRMVNLDEDEIIGKKCYDVFRGELCHSKDCPLELLRMGGQFAEHESIKKRSDGKEIPVIVNAARLEKKGKFVGIVEDFKDITEHKQAEEEILDLQRYTRGLIEVSLDPLVTFDQEGIILDVNEATMRATGRGKEELIGTPFADYFTDPDNAYKGAMLTFETGEVRDYERVMKARDGTETVVSYNASVYKDQTGMVVGAFAAARDITERKEAEIALSESKAALDLIFKIAADGMCVIDADHNIVKVNKTFIRMVDMDEDEIIGKKCYDIFSGELCHSEDCPLEKLEKGEWFAEHESVKKRPDGKEIPVIVNAARLEQNGKFVGIVEDFKDITERKQAEEEIRDLQRYNRGLIEVSLDPLVTFDHEGIIMDVNEATIRATGRGRDELIGTPFADYFTDPDKAYKGAMLTFEAGEVRDYELVMKARDGTETTVAYNASVYKDQTGMVVGAFAAARDITERKKAEIALSESKAEIDLIFQIAADGMCVIDANYNIVKVNKSFTQMVGMDEDEIIGKKCYDIFSGGLCHSEDCPLAKMKKGELFAEHECVKKRPDGKEIPVIVNAARLEKNGKFIGIVEDFKDITERKQAEEEIHELQRYNRGLIEVNLDPLVTFDQEGIIMDVNTATIGATGRSRDELIGTPFADYFTDPKKAHKGAMKVFEIGEIRDYELVMKPKDEAQTTVAVNASVYMDQTGEVVGAFAASRDITLQKKAEHELQETVNRLEVYTTRINSLMVTMLDQITVEKTKGVILDISGLPPDEEVAEPLINIAKFARQLGATCIITGIKHEAVQRLTDAGANLAPITTEQSLLDGLRYTIAMIDEEE